MSIENKTVSYSTHLRVIGFRGNPLRVVLSSGKEAMISQDLLDAFASPVGLISNERDLMRTALKQIAAPRDCGCSPVCQCSSQESLKLECEALQDIAREALVFLIPEAMDIREKGKAILDEGLKQKLREALRFSASRSVMSSDEETRILAAFD